MFVEGPLCPGECGGNKVFRSPSTAARLWGPKVFQRVTDKTGSCIQVLTWGQGLSHRKRSIALQRCKLGSWGYCKKGLREHSAIAPQTLKFPGSEQEEHPLIVTGPVLLTYLQKGSCQKEGWSEAELASQTQGRAHSSCTWQTAPQGAYLLTKELTQDFQICFILRSLSSNKTLCSNRKQSTGQGWAWWQRGGSV